MERPFAKRPRVEEWSTSCTCVFGGPLKNAEFQMQILNRVNSQGHFPCPPSLFVKPLESL